MGYMTTSPLRIFFISTCLLIKEIHLILLKEVHFQLTKAGLMLKGLCGSWDYGFVEGYVGIIYKRTPSWITPLANRISWSPSLSKKEKSRTKEFVCIPIFYLFKDKAMEEGILFKTLILFSLLLNHFDKTQGDPLMN